LPGTTNRESWRTRLWRWGINVFPAYRGTGGRVTFIAADWSEVRVTVPLNWRTRNYVKTIFGGSMYGAVDPIYMFMLIKLLGPEYVVWDKTASIRFRRPGREALFAKFVVTPAELEEIRNGVAAAGKCERSYTVHLTSRSGEVHAIIEKGIHISRR
jgi:acyl-coenzyme A thioesterase PaaI-like protein